MSFKVNKIAAAVAVSLGTSVVGMNVAQADEILFPNIGMSPTVTTILSVINDDDATVPNLHYRYYYKAAAADRYTGVCQEADYKQNTSPNDIVTFDVSGHFGDAKAVLFEPVTSGRYNKSFAIFKNLPPTRAFGIIDNNDARIVGQAVHGEAFIIEFTTGSVWGYLGYVPSRILGTAAGGGLVVGNPYDFSDRVEEGGEVLVKFPATPGDAGFPLIPGQVPDPDNFWTPIAIMPWAGDIETALFVTPISDATSGTSQLRGNLTARIALAVNDPANPALDVMYDRDENPFSGALAARVTCIGRVNVNEMISEATRQFVQDSGGWSNVAVLNPGVVAAGLVPTEQATVLKLEYNDTAPADLDGKPTGSAGWNNGFWLRQGIRESVARTPVGGTTSMMPVYAIPRGQSLNSPYPLIDTTKATAALPFPPVYGSSPLAYSSIASAVQ